MKPRIEIKPGFLKDAALSVLWTFVVLCLFSAYFSYEFRLNAEFLTGIALWSAAPILAMTESWRALPIVLVLVGAAVAVAATTRGWTRRCLITAVLALWFAYGFGLLVMMDSIAPR